MFTLLTVLTMGMFLMVMLVLIILIVALWLINSYVTIPIPPIIKWLLNLVLIVLFIAWVIKYLGLLN